MKSKICEILDIEFPLLAFSHCKDVVAQVSKAGGMGVLGAVGMTPEILEQELNWIDQNVDGKPYGHKVFHLHFDLSSLILVLIFQESFQRLLRHPCHLLLIPEQQHPYND